MKIKHIILPALMFSLVFGSNLTGTRTPYELDDEAAYVICLNNYNVGVVESAIYCALKMQNIHQDEAYFDVSRVLNRLSRSGRTATIRYKANVASIYFKNQELMTKLNLFNSEDGPKFWTTLVTNLINEPKSDEWN